MKNKMFIVALFNTRLNAILGVNYTAFPIYQSKGLLTHLLKRKHFLAAKYIDMVPEIIQHPDFVGCIEGTIELVKQYNEYIFISIKLDESSGRHYIATVFDIKKGKLDAYIKSGRLQKVN